MKIEIGESLLLSWLRHVKECQIVQTNWKASSKWELKNKEVLKQLMQSSSQLFSHKYGYDLYKGNSNVDQLIGQAEIDVMGISYDSDGSQIYAIDVAFHEAGLNYGPKNETVARVIKKCLRTAMCIYGYYGFDKGTIIFTSPKINNAVINDILACVDDITLVLEQLGLYYKIRIIANDDFSDKVLEPVLNVIGDVADTSELFMRSLQMYNLFASKKPKAANNNQQSVNKRKITPEIEAIEYNGLDGLEEMKIGVIVRTVLSKMLLSGEVTEKEIGEMQTKEYSKENFNIQFPLLQKACLTDGESPKRYYSSPLKIYGEDYFLCSEWYEVPANNDRPYLMKWLALHKEYIPSEEVLSIDKGKVDKPIGSDHIINTDRKKYDEKNNIYKVAYYFSRFDHEDIFPNLNQGEAINIASDSLDVKDNTLKNIRDAFDPYCNELKTSGKKRKGWWQKSLTIEMQEIYDYFFDKSKQEIEIEIEEILRIKKY